MAVRHVLINSIGRSGSSMFGEIISTFSAKPFYVFEPLWAVQMGEFIDPSLTLNVLKDTFNCEFNRSMTSPYFQRWPHSGRTFELQPNLTAKSFVQFQMTLSERRRKALQSYCAKVNFKVIKVIRLSLMPIEQQVILLEQLLAEIKDLVIFFLIRDPRAALYSRMKKVLWNTTDTQRFCVEERRIHSAGRALINRGWEKQVRILRYEDIALNPLKCIKSIASFMQMDFSPRTQEWIDINMKGEEPVSSKELENPYATAHRNASSLVRQWGDGDMQLDDVCKSVIDDLEYSKT